MKTLISNTLAIKWGVALIALFSLSNAYAKEPIYTGFFSNNAVSGYDVVAYFTEGQPTQGNKKFSTEYKGANWLFSNAANLAAFKAKPEAYAPQYGGYCAWAVAQNKTASAEADLWKIVDGKLYLNYSDDVQAKWEKDIAGFIEQADKNWPEVIK
jgi:YHS domain-containing protein